MTESTLPRTEHYRQQILFRLPVDAYKPAIDPRAETRRAAAGALAVDHIGPIAPSQLATRDFIPPGTSFRCVIATEKGRRTLCVKMLRYTLRPKIVTDGDLKEVGAAGTELLPLARVRGLDFGAGHKRGTCR